MGRVDPIPPMSVGVTVYCGSTMNCDLDETKSRQLKH